MKKSKALILSLICTPIVTVMILFMTVFGYAYFKVSSEKNFNTNVNVDLLFHRYETTVLQNIRMPFLPKSGLMIRMQQILGKTPTMHLGEQSITPSLLLILITFRIFQDLPPADILRPSFIRIIRLNRMTRTL